MKRITLKWLQSTLKVQKSKSPAWREKRRKKRKAASAARQKSRPRHTATRWHKKGKTNRYSSRSWR